MSEVQSAPEQLKKQHLQESIWGSTDGFNLLDVQIAVSNTHKAEPAGGRHTSSCAWCSSPSQAAHHGTWDEWSTDGQASWCGAWKDVMKAGVPPSLEPWTWTENSSLSSLETQTKLTEMATLF